MHLPRTFTIPRQPDFVIGGPDAPYLRRWFVIPHNRVFNIYLHHFLRSDDDRALHDHPWWNVSIVLRGSYLEHLADGMIRLVRPFRPTLRRAETLHRVQLLGHARPEPVWTLFITGPKIREWGFQCPSGWRHWQVFCDPSDSGAVGRGCD